MKRQSEKMTENALRALRLLLARNFKDTGVVLTAYEKTHDDGGLCSSKEYNALLAGHYALKAAIDKIDYQLNK